MGNCLRHQSSTRYTTVDDDGEDGWHLPAAAKENGIGATGKTTTTTEVKIKITKKQLKKLLAKVDAKDLRVEQVLSHLMRHSPGYEALQRPWRPALQSIPEVN